MNKRLKCLRTNLKKEITFAAKEDWSSNNQLEEINFEIESTFREFSQMFGFIRENIKFSFDEYINSLCTFSDTKEKLRMFLSKTEESYNDCSPIFEKKFDLLLNMNNSTKNVFSLERVLLIL